MIQRLYILLQQWMPLLQQFFAQQFLHLDFTRYLPNHLLLKLQTIWGIGCDATSADAVRKIYLLKKREEKKSMIILLAHENEIEKYVLNPSEKIIDFLSEQKKPTTAIFKNAINLPGELINEDGSIAIRIVKDRFCQMLIG